MAELRITAAVDERVAHEVSVSDARTGEMWGVIEAPFAVAGQVFALKLDEAQTRSARENGLAIALKSATAPFWIVGPGPHAPAPVLPHLFCGTGRGAGLESFLGLFCSVATLQPCDWTEACVLDGLRDRRELGHEQAGAALKEHLAVYFPASGAYLHEDIHGHPADNRYPGVENTGPFAALAMEEPGHPALAIAERGFIADYKPAVDGVAAGSVVAETSYSVAYPMMAMALFTGREALKARAIRQLELNRECLTGEDDLWLRHDWKTHEKSFRNWSRGVAWYYLGLVRTLALLSPRERPESLVREVERMARWIVRHQLESGVWPCFLKEPNVLPDTSGSAGIAAAIALGVRHEMLGTNFLPAARKAYEGLWKYLTPDGWLTGVAQSNKGETHAMDIQRSRHRVIAPWGMGLLAQLAAALHARP